MVLNKKPRLLIAICIFGFAIGLFLVEDGSSKMEARECQIWALFSFVFFAIGAGIATVLDGLMKKLTKKPVVANSFQWGFFGYFGWFSIFLGLGMALSAIWMDSSRIWGGLVGFGAGAGLITGVKSASLLFRK